VPVAPPRKARRQGLAVMDADEERGTKRPVVTDSFETSGPALVATVHLAPNSTDF